MLPRLPAFELADRAQARQRKGETLIPMSGVPVLPMPEHVQSAADAAMRGVFPRAIRGHIDLRRAISDHLASDNGVTVDPERELLITHGAQHGLSIALRALLAPGDEIIIPAPTYFFDGLVRLAAARPVYVPCAEAQSWRYDGAAIEAAVTPKTKALLLCNPNNPTGYTPTLAGLAAVLRVAERHGLIVISDESYARYIHSGPGYTPLQKLRGDYSRLVTVTSLSKNYAFTSWRIGYIVAPPELTDTISNALEWEAVNIGDIAQAAAMAAIKGPQGWLDSVFALYRSKRDRLLQGVTEAGFTAVIPDAGCFAAANLSPVGATGRELEEALLDVGLVAIGLDSFFGPPTHARFLYGGKMEDIVAVSSALRRLAGR